MNAIGLDLSLTATGYAGADGRLTTIRPQAKATEPERRLSQIVASLQALTDQTVTVAVLEGVGGQFHGQIGQKLAGLHWAVRLWLFEQRISVAVVEQTRLKKYATGNGKAEKGEVLEAAAVRAHEQGFPLPLDFDQADAFWLRQIALDNQPERRRAWADGTDLDRYRATVLDVLWGEL